MESHIAGCSIQLNVQAAVVSITVGLAVLGLGGVYHSIFGSERLEDTRAGVVFGYQWQDRFRITGILGAHLGSLAIASVLLLVKAVYVGGLYDTWSSAGGDIRTVKDRPLYS